MDDTLRLIQHLYDEDVDDPTFVQRVHEDEALRREYEQLRAVKDTLDQRPSASPAPSVVDDIVDRAAEAAQAPDEASPAETTGPAPDRAAQAPNRTWTRRLQGVGAALVLLLMVGLGWWQTRPAAPATSGTTVSSNASGAAPVQASEAVPEWDDRDDVVRLHRRIEMMRLRNQADVWEATVQSIQQSRP